MTDTVSHDMAESFKKGQVIFKQGEAGDKMYIIKRGRVRIEMQTGEKKILKVGEFGPQEFFGEMILFGNLIRTATARALEDTEVISINKQLMQRQFSKLPSWFTTMFKTLIERLRKTDVMIIEIKQKLQGSE